MPPAMPAMQQPLPGSSLLGAEKMSHSFSAAGRMMPPGLPGSMGAISEAIVFHADGGHAHACAYNYVAFAQT